MENNKNYLNDLLSDITDVDTFDFATSVRSGNGVPSFGIVNSSTNGKRVTLSTALTSALSITDEMYIMPIASKGIILISSAPIHPMAQHFDLRGEASKVCYNASLVTDLTKKFHLDFSKRVSRSFRDVKFIPDTTPSIAEVRLAVSTASVKEASAE